MAILIAICGNLANLRNLSLDLPLQNILTLQSADSSDPVWWAWNVAGSILALLFGSALLLRQKALAAGESTSALAEVRQAGVLLSRLIVCVALSTFAVSLALLPFIYALPMTGLTPALTNPAAAQPRHAVAADPPVTAGGVAVAGTVLRARARGAEETRADRRDARELPPAARQLVAHFGVVGRSGRGADPDAGVRDHGRLPLPQWGSGSPT